MNIKKERLVIVVISKNLFNTLDLSSRSKRRKAAGLAIELLELIRLAEERSLSRFPLSLQDGEAFANAEYSLDVVIDAIVGLGDAY